MSVDSESLMGALHSKSAGGRASPRAARIRLGIHHERHEGTKVPNPHTALPGGDAVACGLAGGGKGSYTSTPEAVRGGRAIDRTREG